jgi:hypothetical protein
METLLSGRTVTRTNVLESQRRMFASSIFHRILSLLRVATSRPRTKRFGFRSGESRDVARSASPKSNVLTHTYVWDSIDHTQRSCPTMMRFVIFGASRMMNDDDNRRVSESGSHQI